MNSTIKNIVIFVIIFGVLAGGYYFFFANKSNTQDLAVVNNQTTTGENTDNEVGGQFLSTLLNIKTIKLDNTIFSDPSFVSLQDFTTELVDQGNAGRNNPFAPIGQDSQLQTASVSNTTTGAGSGNVFGLPTTKTTKP